MSYIIQIGSRADTAGIDKATGALKRADAAADEFVASIKAGVGIDIGGKIVNSLAAIPGVLQDAVSRGMEFNMQMNDSQIGIANVLAKFQGLNKEAAKSEAAKAMAKIVELEPKTAAGLQDLVQGFLATVASAQSAGVSVEQNIDLVGKFANALANANIPAEQLSQELRAIFTGNITPDAALAKILQINNEDITKAKEAGNLYQFLTEKIGSIGEAGDSAGVRLSTLNSQIDKALGEITKPIFDVWIDGLTELTNAAGTDSEALRQLGVEIGQILKTGISFTAWLTQHPALLASVARGVGILAAAWAAYKITAIIAGLTTKTRAIMASSAAVATETAAINANTAARAANAKAPIGGRGIGGGLGVALAGEAAAYGVNKLGSQGIPDLAAGLTQGGKSSARDMAAADAMRDKNAERIAALAEAIKGTTSTVDRDALMQEMSKEIVASVKGQKEAGFFEEGRTAQNQALSDHAEQLRRLVEVLQNKGSGLSSPEETAAKLEAEKKAAREQKNLADNQATMDAERARRGNAGRDAKAADGISSAKAAMDAGDMAGAGRLLDEQQKFYQDYLASKHATPDAANMNKDELKSAIDLRADIEGYLADIKAAREDLAKSIGEKEKESAEKAKEDALQSLTDQIALLEAQGQKRLADIEASGQLESEISARRKAAEDEIAAKRLGLENQVGALNGESPIAREARQIAAAASQTMRDNAQKAEFSKNSQTKAGELFAGTKRRRGVSTSDAFEENVPIGESLLDSYKANQSRAVGAINGRSILRDDPLSSLRPKPGAGNPGDSGKSNVADAGKEAGDGAKSAGEQAAGAMRELGSTTVSALQNIAKEVSAVKARVEAISKKI